MGHSKLSERKHAAITFSNLIEYSVLMGNGESSTLKVQDKNRQIHTRFVSEFNWAHNEMFCIYMTRKDRNNTFKYRGLANSKSFISKWKVVEFNYEPIFESLYNDDNNKKILVEIELKYKIEHDQVSNWLAREGLM